MSKLKFDPKKYASGGGKKKDSEAFDPASYALGGGESAVELTPIDNPYDLMPRMRKMFPASEGTERIAKAIIEPAAAFMGGASKGATAGYAQRWISPEVKAAMAENEIPAFLGEAVGSLAPGAAITRGVRAVGAAARLPSLMRTGALSGAVEGAVEGGLYDVGGEGPSTDGATMGAVSGGAFGGLGKALSRWGKRSDIYKQLAKERPADRALTPDELLSEGGGERRKDFNRRVKTEVDMALESLMKRQVEPRQQALSKVLEGNVVEVDPKNLRGFQERIPLTEDMRPIFDARADELERLAIQSAIAKSEPELRKHLRLSIGGKEGLRQSLDKMPPEARHEIISRAGEKVYIPAKEAQTMKQRLDRLAEYGKSTAYGNADVRSSGERAKEVADLLRGRLEAIDPRVSRLNAPMSEAMRIADDVRGKADTGALSFIASPVQGDVGQRIRELDRLAGSRLSELGQDVRVAQRYFPSEGSVSGPWDLIRESTKGLRRSGGALVSPITRAAPEGTSSALVNLLLGQTNQPNLEEILQAVQEAKNAGN